MNGGVCHRRVLKRSQCHFTEADELHRHPLNRDSDLKGEKNVVLAGAVDSLILYVARMMERSESFCLPPNWLTFIDLRIALHIIWDNTAIHIQ